MNPTTVRQQLVDVLTSVLAGAHVYATMPDSPEVPAVIVTPDPQQFIDYQQAFGGGLIELRFVLELLVPSVATASGQQTLDAMLSTGTDADTLSVFQALETNRTAIQTAIGGDFVVTTAAGYGQREDPGGNIRWFGADLALTLYMPRT